MINFSNTYIGGEFIYSPYILFFKKILDINTFLHEKFPNKHLTYTGGGYYSIIGILQQIDIKESQNVLLPSYLCHTILYPFQRLNINYRFYKITENLEIDTTDLTNKIDENTRAIYFIDYFGFPQKHNTIAYLQKLKEEKHIILIQDLAQSFFSFNQTFGDFAFNSFRKFLPIDGSIIISNEKICTKYEKSYSNYNFYRFKAQFLRYLYVKYNIGNSSSFLQQFQKADKAYYKKDLLKFNNFNRYLLSKYDIDTFSINRRDIAQIVFKLVKAQMIYKEISMNIVPLGIPILVEKRNLVRKKLIERNIFCPVHWPLTDEIDKSEFPESWYLTNHLLTIPVREDFNTDDVTYLIDNLNNLCV